MRFQLLLVGGGLQNALIALAVLRKDPQASLAVVERDGRLGGNHTWSFHASDVAPGLWGVMEDLIVHTWPAHTVAFPRSSRTLERPYATVRSTRLHEVLSARLQAAPRARMLLGTTISRLEPGAVHTVRGQRIEAEQIVDSRGPPTGATTGAFQKFLGLELELELATPWDSALPCMMDARVEQRDGFRFVYTLPFTRHRLLVEDTEYSTTSRIDAERSRADILSYVEERGMRVAAVLGEEQGALPLPFEPFVPSTAGVLRGGYGGGWFHPATGYSFPAAARLAETIARSWPEAPSPRALAEVSKALGEQIRFFTLLNRLLFDACVPSEQWRVLERFHRLPLRTIERFYAMRTTRLDRARILVGRPPAGLSLGKAFAALRLSRGVP